jgi:4-hydroxybenzoate polyprenyltransferase
LNSQTISADHTPLVVDLDGTLIRSDLLVESFLVLLSEKPLAALKTLGALRKGKSALKASLADQATLDFATLPFDEEVLAFIVAARAEGRSVHLASASDDRYVQAVAEHLGLFDSAIGSHTSRNLSSSEKAEHLVRVFGEGGFDYLGDCKADLKVWARARRAYYKPLSGGVMRRLRKSGVESECVGTRHLHLKAYIRAVRPHQWMKNVLIFAPVVAAHAFGPQLLAALAAFISFSLCASSVYLLNDLLDLKSDREHARKRKRPFASGRALLAHGAVLAPLLLFASVAIAVFLPPKFQLVLAGYYGLTLAYSFWLKRKMMVDVIALACLYGARLVAGSAATGIELSRWLEALAIFLFLSLALVKRSTELTDRLQAGKGDPGGRGYKLTDLPIVEAMAAASAYTAVLVLALYLSSPDVGALYSHPHRLWALCVILLYWIGRILMKAHRGEMHDDPVVYAVRDRVSQICGVLFGVVVLLSV